MGLPTARDYWLNPIPDGLPGFQIQRNPNYVPGVFRRSIEDVIEELTRVITPNMTVYSFYNKAVQLLSQWALRQRDAVDKERMHNSLLSILSAFFYGPVNPEAWAQEVYTQFLQPLMQRDHVVGMSDLMYATSPTLMIAGLSFFYFNYSDMWSLIANKSIYDLYTPNAMISETADKIKQEFASVLAEERFTRIKALASRNPAEIEAAFPEGMCPICNRPLGQIMSGARMTLVLSTESTPHKVIPAHYECVWSGPLPDHITGVGIPSAGGGNVLLDNMEEAMLNEIPDIEVSSSARRVYANTPRGDSVPVLVTTAFMTANTYECAICGRSVVRSSSENVKMVTLKDGTTQYLCKQCSQRSNLRGRHTSVARTNPRYIRAEGEPETEPCYGIELEVELNRHGLVLTADSNAYRIAAISAVSQLAGELGISAESDGSLTDGIEFVFQPRSVKAWVEALPKLKQFCDILTNYRFVGHDSSNAGLHIHSSYYKHVLGLIDWNRPNAPITAEERPAIYLGIVQTYLVVLATLRDWLWVSRRVLDNMQRWSSIPNIADKIVQDAAVMGFDTRASVCVGSAETTVEYRMFRSTLKAETIVATIGLVKALEEAVLTNHALFRANHEKARGLICAADILNDKLTDLTTGVVVGNEAVDRFVEQLKSFLAEKQENILLWWQQIGSTVFTRDPSDIWRKAATDKLEAPEFVEATLRAAEMPIPEYIPEGSMRLLELLRDYIPADVLPLVEAYVQNIVLKYGRAISTDYREVA
jgi:DNA-directed RNA polymerase subunit RPC12/RpoP